MKNDKTIQETAQMVLKISDEFKQLSSLISSLLENPETENIDVSPDKEEPDAILEEISLETVRGALAEKSQAGFTSEVRAIISKYGATRLSEIDPKDYPKVLKDAQELSNG